MTTSGGAKRKISLNVNGEPKTVHAYPMERLLDVLRHQIGLTGAKEGCGEGECGACAVIVDGALVNSCLGADTSGAGIEHYYNRRARQGHAIVRRAGSVHGVRGRAVRYLHSWNDPGDDSFVEQEAQADEGRDSGGLGGEFVPLHRIHPDFRGCRSGSATRS